MEKRNMLITITFPDEKDEVSNIDTERDLQKEIISVMRKFKAENRIKHFLVADDELISETLRKQQNFRRI